MGKKVMVPVTFVRQFDEFLNMNRDHIALLTRVFRLMVSGRRFLLNKGLHALLKLTRHNDWRIRSEAYDVVFQMAQIPSLRRKALHILASIPLNEKDVIMDDMIDHLPEIGVAGKKHLNPVVLTILLNLLTHSSWDLRRRVVQTLAQVAPHMTAKQIRTCVTRFRPLMEDQVPVQCELVHLLSKIAVLPSTPETIREVCYGMLSEKINTGVILVRKYILDRLITMLIEHNTSPGVLTGLEQFIFGDNRALHYDLAYDLIHVLHVRKLSLHTQSLVKSYITLLAEETADSHLSGLLKRYLNEREKGVQTDIKAFLQTLHRTGREERLAMGHDRL